MREADIEKYLVARVKLRGGEVRKVHWIGRRGAPDRIVMLPGMEHPECIDYDIAARTIWVELKAPGKKATFPANAHERCQAREHERMRAVGQRIEVVDSFEDVDEVLR